MYISPIQSGVDCASTGRHPDVMMVSTSYPADLSDWRGLFIRHLVEALARRDDLNLQLWAPPGKLPVNVEYLANARERRWLAELMAAGGIAHLIRMRGMRALTAPLRLFWMLRKAYRRNPTVSLYHINWLQNALMLPRNGFPLLTTVLGTDMQLLHLPLVRPLLRTVFRHRPAVICPNAEWMVPALTRAFGDVAQVRFVPFGIDPAWYRVERRLPPIGAEIWLCVSRLTEGKIGTLFDWCEPYFSNSGRELHLFGPMQQDIAVPDWVHYHGAATPDALRREWFPRAQGLITLSRHAEGRPQVMLEAMATGLPIIASRLPAHADLVHHGESGLICNNAAEVGHALDILGDTAANRRMGEYGRNRVAAEIGTWDDCAGRYASLYRELLGQCAP